MFNTKFPKMDDVDWLKQKYYDERLNFRQISEIIGCSISGVRKSFIRHGLKARSAVDRQKTGSYKSKIKYKKIHDKDWLIKKYHDEHCDFKKIANLIGCSIYSLSAAFSDLGILTRNRSERATGRDTESKYELLNNKNWLYQKYIIEGLSGKEISKIIGAKNGSSVTCHLKKHGIEVRSVSDGLTLGRVEDGFVLNMPVIEGCLMGDGSMLSANPKSDFSYPYFSKTNKNYDHVKFVSKILFPEKWEERIKIQIRNKSGKIFNYFSFKSLVHKELMKTYRKWYPPENNYKKIIPYDLELSSEMLLHWFMDDGCSCQVRKWSKTKQIIINLCTHGFEKKYQEFLIERIWEKFGIKMNLQRNGKYWFIHITPSKVPLFYEIIGPCPVPSMEYKWK